MLLGAMFGRFSVTTVGPDGVAFEVFAYLGDNATVLVDAWTLPR